MLRAPELFGNGLTFITSLFAAMSLQQWNVMVVPAIVGAVTVVGVIAQKFFFIRGEVRRVSIDNAKLQKVIAEATAARVNTCLSCKANPGIVKNCPFHDDHRPYDCAARRAPIISKDI